MLRPGSSSVRSCLGWLLHYLLTKCILHRKGRHCFPRSAAVIVPFLGLLPRRLTVALTVGSPLLYVGFVVVVSFFLWYWACPIDQAFHLRIVVRIVPECVLIVTAH